MVGLSTLNVVIAEDSALMRDQLAHHLSQVDDLAIVGVAMDGPEAIETVARLKPDLLILDVSMPLQDGLSVLREIREENSSTVVAMFTADPSSTLRKACLEAGANFFFAKSQMDELIEVCRAELRMR